ncbi:hypothetical protein TPA0907_56850 [Micromonospora humidisoli]|nr:hypothetical protein TPA0907_56850 [Micromonospora sp. AKA109]
MGVPAEDLLPRAAGAAGFVDDGKVDDAFVAGHGDRCTVVVLTKGGAQYRVPSDDAPNCITQPFDIERTRQHVAAEQVFRRGLRKQPKLPP